MTNDADSLAIRVRDRRLSLWQPSGDAPSPPADPHPQNHDTMSKSRQSALALLCCTASMNVALAFQSGELATNGDFELGDTSSWQSFPTLNSTFDVTTDANSGTFGAEIFNDDVAAAAIVKQANVGVGAVQPGDTIRVSFAAKGSSAAGGVAFAEFFSEVSGGGVSAAEILTGAPLPLTSDWQTFCITTTAGSDVSGGVTLQFGAITGAATGSVSSLFIDDVSISINEMATNGDFELGDTSGWVSFPTPNSTFTAQADANTGSFGGRIFNPDAPAGAVIKQANLGAGIVNPGDVFNVSFSAKGTFGPGGVAFAEFFSELSGGGVSSAEILTGGPLPLTNNWQPFSFTVTAGPDVSGGITLQFVAATGAVAGSTAELFIDDVTITNTSGSTENFCVTSPNSAGPGATMSSSGSTSIAANDFVIEANGLPPGQFYLFWVGTGTAFTPSFNGTLCIGTPCRLQSPGQATATGVASKALPSSAYTGSGCIPPIVGSRYNFQCVYRDNVGTGANWSDALCVTFGL